MNYTAIIVTYNRLSLLKQSLEAYLSMEYKFDNLVIVNNGSTDDTEQFLDTISNQNGIHILKIENNIGASWGFNRGIKYVMDNMKTDWIFIADDDAIPDTKMLYYLNQVVEKKATDEIQALCTSVYNHGQIDLVHRRKLTSKWLPKEAYIPIENYDKDEFSVDLATFVGLMIKPSLVQKIGLPVEDYYIRWDDTEYSIRIRKACNILCIPKSIMNHDVPAQDRKISWKHFYNFRNKTVTIKKHYHYFVYLIFYFYKRLLSVTFIGQILYKNSKEIRMIEKKALYKARKNIMGMDEVYKPGWTPSSK